MNTNLLKAFVLGLMLSSTIACSRTPSTKLQEKAPEDIAKFDTKSCNFNLSEGDPADLTALGTQKITTTHFEKEFNEAYLEAILTASVSNTIDFINKTGATVYKTSLIPSKLCHQPLFKQASSLPNDLKKIWTNASGSNGDKDAVLLGLYLPVSDSANSPSLNSNAAIIIRENTNRWTLVHEFMHHLFSVRSNETGYDQSAEQDLLSTAAQEIQLISENDSLSLSEKAVKLIAPYLRFASAMDSRIVQFPLEEMTIETTLKALHNERRLQYVPTTSNWYITTSANKALSGYKIIEDVGDYILSNLNYTHANEVKLIRNTLTNVFKRKLEIETLKESYPLDSRALELSDEADAKINSHIGCSHAAETTSILEIAHKVKVATSFLQR